MKYCIRLSVEALPIPYRVYTSATCCNTIYTSESESECATKNQLEVILVGHCTNQTKRLLEKLKRKPLSSPVSVKAKYNIIQYYIQYYNI